MKQDIIPENETGKQVDLFEEIELGSNEDAVSAYNTARERLLNPAIWKTITGAAAADFEAADVEDLSEPKRVSVGDYIKIDLPAPGLSAGDGHDWVRVETIEENFDRDADESFAMKVKVCENPEHPEEGVAHFFAEGASSTFIITRKAQVVKASYHGRNETPNLENPALKDKIRNAVIATGAMAGVSELQWKAFLKGLLTHHDKR